MHRGLIIAAFLSLAAAAAQAGPAKTAELALDENPAVELEWGYRPEAGSVSAVTPPSFSWRPQKSIVSWELECGRGESPQEVAYRAEGIEFNVHCPPQPFPPGAHTWRYRGKDANGNVTRWSRAHAFTIAADAVKMPMPPRAELLGRIPRGHPRLFVRPEQMAPLGQLARGPLKDHYDQLVRECEGLLADPPPTAEPRTYPPGMKRLSEEWRELWWGNRLYTIRALNGAATLAFTRLLGGKEEYGQLARRILLDCAKWDPMGSTGYRYNDEAGMPYAYYFSRAYTFVYDLLSEEERAICRGVMKARGEEMYNHLCPRHLWQPYSSHSNRAWHFLGEVGIAFLGEIEGADDWAWFAANVFFNVYPVWSDDDGGWHEGASYWHSYLDRFTWWADVMRAAMDINAYRKPFFSKAGYYAMYLMPPGKVGGGFGDGAPPRRASDNVPLMSTFAAQANNAHWQWYVEQMGGPRSAGGYVGFVRGALPKVDSRPPTDLPPSRWFRGTGQAYLNTTLVDTPNNVQVVFKSSPFGSCSHGNEANNSFVLWAYGKQLLTRSGHYDTYGSEHHSQWVWSTRSLNNILVNGQGQVSHSATSKGEIIAFKTTPAIDIVVGEAGSAYRVREGSQERRLLDRFTRAILFIKPELVIVYDRLAAREPSTFDYWLHAINKFESQDQHHVRVRNEDVLCEIDFLTPEGLRFALTNEYDPNPRPRIKLREWHMTATTRDPQRALEFVTIYRPHRANTTVPEKALLQTIAGGYALRAELSDGEVAALLPTDDGATLEALGLRTTGRIVVQRRGRDGSIIETVTLGKE